MRWRRASSSWLNAILSVWFWRHWWTVDDRENGVLADGMVIDAVHGTCGCGGAFTIQYRRGRHGGVISSTCPAGVARMWLVRRDHPTLPVARLLP